MKFAIFLIRSESYSAKLANKIAWFFVTISQQMTDLSNAWHFNGVRLDVDKHFLKNVMK